MRGFTLLELLIVIGIVVILIGVAIAAINPARQIRQANRATRWANVSAIADAVAQYEIERGGEWRDCAGCSVSTTAQRISSTACNLCGCLVADYLGSLPVDPAYGTAITDCGATYDTHYDIVWSAMTPPYRVTVSSAEESGISATR